jgi:dCMP deaminase
MKQKFIDLYMEIAHVVAKTSTATRLKVGAVAVKDHRVLSLGYNGTPPGDDNECEFREYTLGGSAAYLDEDGSSYNIVTKPEVIHAEQNLIYKMARDGQSAKGADIFVTHAPCIECAKAIVTSGFSRVWFGEQYRSDEGLKFLEKRGIEVVKISKNAV